MSLYVVKDKKRAETESKRCYIGATHECATGDLILHVGACRERAKVFTTDDIKLLEKHCADDLIIVEPLHIASTYSKRELISAINSGELGSVA